MKRKEEKQRKKYKNKDKAKLKTLKTMLTLIKEQIKNKKKNPKEQKCNKQKKRNFCDFKPVVMFWGPQLCAVSIHGMMLLLLVDKANCQAPESGECVVELGQGAGNHRKPA